VRRKETSSGVHLLLCPLYNNRYKIFLKSAFQKKSRRRCRKKFKRKYNRGFPFFENISPILAREKKQQVLRT
jgi:hypothetical protein